MQDSAEHRPLTPEQRDAAKTLLDLSPPPPAWALHREPGQSRQLARASWRARTKRLTGKGPRGPIRRQPFRVVAWNGWSWKPRNKYVPHQGKQECARRVRRMVQSAEAERIVSGIVSKAIGDAVSSLADRLAARFFNS